MCVQFSRWGCGNSIIGAKLGWVYLDLALHMLYLLGHFQWVDVGDVELLGNGLHCQLHSRSSLNGYMHDSKTPGPEMSPNLVLLGKTPRKSGIDWYSMDFSRHVPDVDPCHAKGQLPP